jgi:mRNA interferase HigB
MRVISRRRLREFWTVHPQSQAPLNYWYRAMELTKFSDFHAIKASFPAADHVAPYTIFDIGGNKFRLIVAIHYNTGKVFVRHVLTHADYDTWSYEMRRRKKPRKGK